MSENKYIIDKDSLTGIADTVRDKLGTGEATTDSQTGDIIYPEDKGYYLKKEVVAKISGFGWSQTGYSGNFGINYAPRIESADWDEAVGEPWYSAEITLINVGGSYLYDMTVSYSGGGSQNFTNVRSSTYTVSAPNGSNFFNLNFFNKYNPSTYNGSSSLGSLVVIFKDAEGKPIKPKQSSYRYLWRYSGNYGTYNFGTEDVPTPIPFSIDDIQDKITNYLGKKSGLIYRYHINPQSNEKGTSFAGTPLSEMNVLDYGVTSVSQIKFMLVYGYNTSSSFTWYPSSSTSFTMIINGKPFYSSDSGNVYWPDWTSDKRYSSYKFQLCPSKLSNWPLGVMRGTTSSYMGENCLQYPKIVFMVLDLEATG